MRPSVSLPPLSLAAPSDNQGLEDAHQLRSLSLLDRLSRGGGRTRPTNWSAPATTGVESRQQWMVLILMWLCALALALARTTTTVEPVQWSVGNAGGHQVVGAAQGDYNY